MMNGHISQGFKAYCKRINLETAEIFETALACTVAVYEVVVECGQRGSITAHVGLHSQNTILAGVLGVDHSIEVADARVLHQIMGEDGAAGAILSIVHDLGQGRSARRGVGGRAVDDGGYGRAGHGFARRHKTLRYRVPA